MAVRENEPPGRRGLSDGHHLPTLLMQARTRPQQQGDRGGVQKSHLAEVDDQRPVSAPAENLVDAGL